MAPGPFSYAQERRIKMLIEETLKPRQWQLCPKCQGSGIMPTPSYSSSSTTTCDVCKGAKVLATPEAQ